MKPRQLRAVLALLACILLFVAPARAQMSEGERKAAARAAFTEGVQLQDQGKPADALSRFETAQKLFDAPTHLLHIAECQALTGKLVEASETYELLIRKSLPTGSPDVFVQAQEQAKAELPSLRQRIPTMRVNVKPEPASLQNLQIQANDKQIPVELVGIARPVNPGSYKMAATANGYATPQAVDVEIKERENKSVDLTLQQGATPAVVVVPPGAGSGTPPDEKPKDKDQPKPGPSSFGLLIGGRVGAFVPAGNVDRDRKFDKIGTAGPGIGIDLMARLAKILLVGGSLEFASLGAPSSTIFPEGSTNTVTTTAFYVGALGGIVVPNIDRFAFLADLGLGFRVVNFNAEITPRSGAVVKREETFSGVDFGLGAGMSIPVGPIRLVPKTSLSVGSFTSRDASGAGTTVVPGAATATDSATHVFVGLVLGIYYHVDLGKKTPPKAASRPDPRSAL